MAISVFFWSAIAIMLLFCFSFELLYHKKKYQKRTGLCVYQHRGYLGRRIFVLSHLLQKFIRGMYQGNQSVGKLCMLAMGKQYAHYSIMKQSNICFLCLPCAWDILMFHKVFCDRIFFAEVNDYLCRGGMHKECAQLGRRGRTCAYGGWEAKATSTYTVMDLLNTL